MGEGWGEGGKFYILFRSHPPPLCPLPPGEGKYGFYEAVFC